MAIKLISTKQAAQLHGVKVLVYGSAGAGKTVLCGTTGGKPLIISAEAGLLSLRHLDLPVLTVKTIEDVHEAYRFVNESGEGQAFDWICIDSLSEIAEVVLNTEKKKVADVRQAYGALQEQMADLIRAFRDLPERNVYMSAKMERVKDEMTGAMLYHPAMPGNKLPQQLPYFFDEVLALRVEQDADGKAQRWLQTSPDLQYQAKDRSGALDMYEHPDLSTLSAKISGAPTQPTLNEVTN